MEKTLITQEQLKSILSYDIQTGLFHWTKRMAQKTRIGTRAGTDDGKGYVAIRIMGRIYRAHRLAWLWCYGEWPQGIIDHINGARADNRISNLRDTDNRTNMQNQRIASAKKVTNPYLGVTRTRHGTWKAIITINGRRKYISSHKTAEEAHQAYLREKRLHHPGCTI